MDKDCQGKSRSSSYNRRRSTSFEILAWSQDSPLKSRGRRCSQSFHKKYDSVFAMYMIRPANFLGRGSCKAISNGSAMTSLDPRFLKRGLGGWDPITEPDHLNLFREVDIRAGQDVKERARFLGQDDQWPRSR